MLDPDLRRCPSAASEVFQLLSAVRTWSPALDVWPMAFSMTGPMAYNSLPDRLRYPARSVDSFRRHMKTSSYQSTWSRMGDFVITR